MTPSRKSSARWLAAVAFSPLLLLLAAVSAVGQPPGRGPSAVRTASGVVLPVPPGGFPGSPVGFRQDKEKAKDGDEAKAKDKDAGDGKAKDGDKESPPADFTPEPEVGPELSLGQCLAIALDRSPALRAAHASEASTRASLTSLDNIGRVGQLFAPELPVRKDQATRGQIAPRADCQMLHNEIVYNVTRTYYTVVYARQQEQVADEVVAKLELLIEAGKNLLKLPDPGTFSQLKLLEMSVALETVRGLKVRAQQGARKGMAGLRQAMSVDTVSSPFRVKDKELPVMAARVPLPRQAVVDMALARRPELALAAVAVDAFRLEVYAQGQIPYRRTVPTLASASDIHARPVPPASRGVEYRPGAIAPEMPPQLVGSRADRVEKALALSHKMEAVFDHTVTLIRADAEVVYEAYQQAAQAVEIGKRQFKVGREMLELSENLVDTLRTGREQVVRSFAQAGTSQAEYVQAVYDLLVQLAELERVTAGGVQPPFPGR